MEARLVRIWIATYSVDLNGRNIWILNFLKFEIQMVGYLNGRFIGFVLFTRLTIWILDQHVRKQGVHLSSIQMVKLSSIQIPDHLASNYFSTIWKHTELIWYSDSHYTLFIKHWNNTCFKLVPKSTVFPLTTSWDDSLMTSHKFGQFVCLPSFSLCHPLCPRIVCYAFFT